MAIANSSSPMPQFSGIADRPRWTSRPWLAGASLSYGLASFLVAGLRTLYLASSEPVAYIGYAACVVLDLVGLVLLGASVRLLRRESEIAAAGPPRSASDASTAFWTGVGLLFATAVALFFAIFGHTPLPGSLESALVLGSSSGMAFLLAASLPMLASPSGLSRWLARGALILGVVACLGQAVTGVLFWEDSVLWQGFPPVLWAMPFSVLVGVSATLMFASYWISAREPGKSPGMSQAAGP